jgi:hypothetical protein
MLILYAHFLSFEIVVPVPFIEGKRAVTTQTIAPFRRLR